MASHLMTLPQQPVASSLSTRQGLATRARASYAYQATNSSQPDTREGSTGPEVRAPTRAYSSGDEREVCYWDTGDVFCKRPLLQGQEIYPTYQKHRNKNKLGRTMGQRNMFQMKEQDKTPRELLSEVKAGNLSETECKVMMVKMTKELWRKMDSQSEKLEVFKKRVRKYIKTIRQK